MFFDTLGQLQDEIRDYFPYKVMDVPLAEADDIIAVITKHYKQVDPILIVSSDKDFIQLLDHNVSIYRPAQDELVMFSQSDLVATPIYTTKTFYTAEQVDQYRKEHIIRGDSGDGVPNFLSPDEVFVTGGRQKSIYAAKVTE
jgi:5'-3' exonuclease